MATPLLVQYSGELVGEIGKNMYKTKLVECPVVDNVPFL